MLLITELVALALIVIGCRESRHIVNPLSCFALIWGGILLLYQLRLSKWQEPIAPETYLVFIAVLISFGALYFVGLALADKIMVSNALEKTKWATVEINPNVIKLLFSIWAVIEVVETIYSGGLPLIWHLSGDVRTYFDYGIPSLHGLMNSLGLVIMALCAYQLITHREHRACMAIILCCVGAFYILLVTRQVIISAIIELGIIATILKPKIVKKTIIPITIIGVLAFGILGNIRTGYATFLYVAQIDTNISPLFIGIYWVYMYLTMTVANINSLVQAGMQTFGVEALASFLPSVFNEVINFGPSVEMSSYLVTPAFNVSGFFVYFYLAFGAFGAGAISALYGFLGGFFAKLARKRECEISILLHAVMMQIVLLSFFDNMLLYLPSSFQIIIIILIAFCSKVFERNKVVSEQKK